MKASMQALSVGLPDREKSSMTPRFGSQVKIARMNQLSLSTRIVAGKLTFLEGIDLRT
ncbi:hypothetical protein ACVINW_003756 [Bradyrhizobium sp. USDA 4461]